MRPSARRVLRALEAYEIRRVEERAGSHRYTLTGPKGSA
jgi:hypothetical protein